MSLPVHAKPRLTINLVRQHVFAKQPMVVVDVGARGGFGRHWNHYRKQIELIGFEADEVECAALNQASPGPRRRFIPIALDNTRHTRAFYNLRHPASSSFYLPRRSMLRRFPWDNLTTLSTVKLVTDTFDRAQVKYKLPTPDFFKLDAEGAERDILEGSNAALQMALGVCVEVTFVPIREGQPFFSDIDVYLRERGFTLYVLHPYQHTRRIMSSAGFPSKYGQTIWAQVLYLRDAVGEVMDGTSKLGTDWPDIRLLKLASLMETYCQVDSAMELVKFAAVHGQLQNHNYKTFLNLLTPRVGGQYLTYKEYRQQLQACLPNTIDISHIGQVHRGKWEPQLALK